MAKDHLGGDHIPNLCQAFQRYLLMNGLSSKQPLNGNHGTRIQAHQRTNFVHCIARKTYLAFQSLKMLLWKCDHDTALC